MNCGISSSPVARNSAANARDAAVAHRTELQDRERTPPVADSRLAEQHRPAIVDPNSHGHERHHWRKDGQSGAGARNVEQTLET